MANLDAQAERDPEEEGDFMAFEQLIAEASAKKDSKHDKKEKHKHPRQSANHFTAL